MDFRHPIVTCLFSMLRLSFETQKVKESYAIFLLKTWGCFGVIHPHVLGEYIRVLWVFGIGVLAFLSYRERYWKRLFNMFRADCLLLTDSLPVYWSYEWSFSLCGLRPVTDTPRNFSFSLITVPHRLVVALDRR